MEVSALSSLRWLGRSFLCAFILAQLLFWRENPIVVGRLVMNFYWLWIIPGWFIVHRWTSDPLERFIASVPISLVLIGLGGYYLGLLGLKIGYSALVIPAAAILFGRSK